VKHFYQPPIPTEKPPSVYEDEKLFPLPKKPIDLIKNQIFTLIWLHNPANYLVSLFKGVYNYVKTPGARQLFIFVGYRSYANSINARNYLVLLHQQTTSLSLCLQKRNRAE